MRVLFIGNSYTYYHRMPELVAALAASGTPGARLVCESVTEGGMTLEWHAHNDETLRAIRQGGWDAVVMQEQSTRPVRMRDRMLKFGQFLAQEAESIGAQTVSLCYLGSRAYSRDDRTPLPVVCRLCRAD